MGFDDGIFLMKLVMEQSVVFGECSMLIWMDLNRFEWICHLIYGEKKFNEFSFSSLGTRCGDLSPIWQSLNLICFDGSAPYRCNDEWCALCIDEIYRCQCHGFLTHTLYIIIIVVYECSGWTFLSQSAWVFVGLRLFCRLTVTIHFFLSFYIWCIFRWSLDSVCSLCFKLCANCMLYLWFRYILKTLDEGNR